MTKLKIYFKVDKYILLDYLHKLNTYRIFNLYTLIVRKILNIKFDKFE